MAEFLLDRFPVTSQEVSVPVDGDRARPLEIYTRGGYSRRQIDRELSYFVGLGTPCLVQTKEKGSSLDPKRGGGYALECTEIKYVLCALISRVNLGQNHLQHFACEMV